jgi:UDP-N-acetylmuramate dehydrogenase
VAPGQPAWGEQRRLGLHQPPRVLGRRPGRSGRAEGKHANFIQADEGGSADDVWRLIGRVRAAVEESSGVRLGTEVRLVGFDRDPSEVWA